MMYGAWLLAQTSAVGIGMHTVVLYLLWALLHEVWFGWPQCGWECNKLQILFFLLFFHKCFTVLKHSHWLSPCTDALICPNFTATMYGAWWLAHRNAQVLYIIVCTLFAVLHMLLAQIQAVWSGLPQCGVECKQTSDFVFFYFFHK